MPGRARHPHRRAVPQLGAPRRARSEAPAAARHELAVAAVPAAQRAHASDSGAGDDHAGHHREARRRRHPGSAGHSEASLRRDRPRPSRMDLRGFTHLFNAMARLEPRDPASSAPRCTIKSTWCGIIVDGHHVDPSCCSSRCAASATIASCWSPTPCRAWAATGLFVLQGRASPSRQCCRDENGTLAGTDLDMAAACATRCRCWACRCRRRRAWPASIRPNFSAWPRIRAHRAGYRANLVLADDAAACARDLDRRALVLNLIPRTCGCGAWNPCAR